eukprot:315886-Hanusia_phi.AAC.9
MDRTVFYRFGGWLSQLKGGLSPPGTVRYRTSPARLELYGRRPGPARPIRRSLAGPGRPGPRRGRLKKSKEKGREEGRGEGGGEADREDKAETEREG